MKINYTIRHTHTLIQSVHRTKSQWPDKCHGRGEETLRKLENKNHASLELCVRVRVIFIVSLIPTAATQQLLPTNRPTDTSQHFAIFKNLDKQIVCV